jgi:ribose transport system ATP-binding protein
MHASPTAAFASLAPRFAARGLCKRFGGTAALDGVDLAIGAGEVHALLGENGAGKSTLVRCLAGVHAPDAGAMELAGRHFAPADPAAARAGGIAVIYQELALAQDLSVEDNLLLGREARRGPFVTRARTRDLARAALAPAGLGELDPRCVVAELPLATRQRVEIARALLGAPRLIVLDEPTSSLGPREADALRVLVHALARPDARGAPGASILYIAHDLAELRAVATRYTVLRDGRSVESGVLSERSDAELVRAMVGRAVDALYPRSAARPGEVVAALRDLSTSDGLCVRELDVRRGEVLGLAGLIGAGRSELLHALHGLGASVRGGLRVLGRDGTATAAQRWRDGAGLLSEDRRGVGLMAQRSLAENIALPRLAQLARGAWPARGAWLAPRATERYAAPWLERLGVRCRGPLQPVGELSGGNQQKVQLARLLAADCALLWLDEPTRGVDIGARAEIYRWIDALARPRGAEIARAVVIASSALPELFGVCDRIAVVRRTERGAAELLAARSVSEITPEAVLTAAAGGAW